MPQFPHLQFVTTVSGKYKGKRGGGGSSQITQDNRDNLPAHGTSLKQQIDAVRQNWDALIREGDDKGFATGSNETIPLFLQVDPLAFNYDQLKTWGIEIISEEENGFIIAASVSSDLPTFTAKLAQMMAGEDEYGVLGLAALWKVETRERSLENVVSDTLLARWDKIEEEEGCWVDVSINIGAKMPAGCPDNATTRQRNAWQKAIEEYDEISEKRQEQLIRIVESNGGSLESGFATVADSATCRIKIPGLGIKNLFFHLPYVWEIKECDIAAEIEKKENAHYTNYEATILAPAADAPKVCVIDSGMQIGHRLLAPAVHSSISYVPNDTSVADSVAGGGHGTRVGGAVLYPNTIPNSGTHQPIAWLQNARILEGTVGMLNRELFPPELMRRIVDDHLPTRIYNMSVQTPIPCRLVHMSAWAAEIDQLSFEHDVLFIVCAGNLVTDISMPTRKGLVQHLTTGSYPSYLGEASCRIGNPAQSSQSITVGSVCYDKIDTDTHTSFGHKDWPSAFSRTGLGMWGMVKPDVVEYGGDNVRTAAGTFVTLPSSSPELVSSTTGGKAVSRDVIGTSYAAPKVAHIAAALQHLFPASKTLLYRALIAQSARWPDYAENDAVSNKLFHFRTLGYGIPDIERATENTESRITYVTENEIVAKNARIYSINIPGIGRPGDNEYFRLDVTLSYAARPRRTRRYLRSYLSTHLQWQMAKLGESMESFQARLKFTLANDTGDEVRRVNTMGVNDITWQLGKRRNDYVNDVRGQDSTLQKDWALIRGYELPQDMLIFAVTAHQGWEKKEESIPFALAVTLTSMAGELIYERIELANQVEIETEV